MEINKFKIVFDPGEDFTCPILYCTFVGSKPQNLHAHFRSVHSNDKSFESMCLFSRNCFHSEKFKTYSALDSHIRKFHKSFFDKEEPNAIPLVLPHVNVPGGVVAEPEGLEICSAPDPTQVPGVNRAPGPCRSFQNEKADFVRHLLADQKLTQTDVQAVMKGAHSLVTSEVVCQLQQAISLLEDNGCSPDHVQLIQSQIDSYKRQDLFQGLRGQRNQQNYFKKNYGLLMPKKIFLPFDPSNIRRQKSNRDQQRVREHFVYISLLGQLEQLLQIDDVKALIEKKKRSVPGVYSNFEDGVNYRSSPLFQTHPDALQIHVYMDEAQLSNDPNSSDHKIVFSYFSLANLPPKFRSTFKCMNLLSMFYFSQVKKFGIDVFLKPLVDDLKQLENGVELTIHSEKVRVWGTMTALVADNLASHQVGGFKVGFGRGFRKCRSCLAVDEEIQTKFSDIEFLPRTKKDHDEHCASLLVSELKEHFSWLYGLNHSSIFNSLKYFHVIGGLAPDIMHDVLEGIIPLLICLVLSHCRAKKYITLSALNYIIKNFKYGHANARDKPPPITLKHLSENSLQGSATQKWLLFVSLPIMIGTLVKRGDRVWRCFITFHKICRLIFSNSISNYELLLMGSLIEDFLSEFKTCFDRRLIPKMHHLVHYPRHIRYLGPLGTVWCMRYEGKHAYFKSLQRKVRNFINPPWTLSYRHQQWISSKYLDSNGHLLKPEHKYSPKTPCYVRNLSVGGQIASKYGLDSFSFIDLIVFQHTWIQIGSTRMKVNESVLLCPLQGRVLGQFGLLVNIISHNGQILFVIKMYRTRIFDVHLQAYRVIEREDNFHLVVSPYDLLEFSVYSLYEPGFMPPDVRRNFKYVVTKTHVIDYLIPKPCEN